jgi:5-methylcytosine-specific restriction protein B
MNNEFTWTSFYMEFANKLMTFKNNRAELLSILETAHSKADVRYPFIDKGSGQKLSDICPFTTFGAFNKGIKDAKRMALINALAELMNVQAPQPTDFNGIPVLMPQMSWLPWHVEDVGILWNLFESSLKLADNSTPSHREGFIEWYNAAIKCKGVNWNVTVGLYWIRPYFYLSLDGRNRHFLLHSKAHQIDVKVISELKSLPDAETYLELNDLCKTTLSSGNSNIKDIPELSLAAWLETTADKPERKSVSDTVSAQPSNINDDIRQENEKHYWIYSPGERARLWEEFSQQGIMGIGWEELGDLNQYPDKESMRLKMMELYDESRSHKNASLATWQFVHQIREGDVVFVKRGMREIIGCGIIESAYEFNSTRNEYNNIRKVRWTHTGSWEHPGQAAMKTLTDITNYTEYVQKLEMLVMGDDDSDNVTSVDVAVEYPPYSAENFLEDVYLSP